MLKRTLFASVLALYWGIGGAANWQTGSFTLTSHVSAAQLPESSELLIPSTVDLPRKLIRRPAIAPIPLPPPPQTTPSVPNSPHTLIQRPSVSSVPLPPPPATTSQIPANLPSKLIRRPSVNLASAPAPASTAPVTSVHSPQTASQIVNGVSASIVPSAGSTTSGSTKPKNVAQAAIVLGSVTAPIFAPSFQSALASAPVNPIPFASVGQLSAAAQSGAASANYPRKLTQRPEVAAILASPATSGSPPPPSSGTATLTWNASTSSDVAGYNIYVGTSSGVYGPSINAGNVTSYQVINLAVGQTYFFAVTAYDTSNDESGFSNEVSKSIF